MQHKPEGRRDGGRRWYRRNVCAWTTRWRRNMILMPCSLP